MLAWAELMLWYVTVCHGILVQIGGANLIRNEVYGMLPEAGRVSNSYL